MLNAETAVDAFSAFGIWHARIIPVWSRITLIKGATNRPPLSLPPSLPVTIPLMLFRIFLLCLGFGAMLSIGCSGETAESSNGDQPTVVLYTAIDRPYAEQIVADFERETGIKVLLKTDAEATKTTGLATALVAERNNPQADVWWNNEIFHTLNVAREGVLEPYVPATAGEIGEEWRHPDNLYTPVALRARVLVVSTDPAAAPLVADVDDIQDLLDPRLKGRIAMATPKFGTTGGHVASLYQIWGDTEADAFFSRLRANDIALLGGNATVVEYVASGQMLAGLTDNDDVAHAQAQNKSVKMVMPNQDDGELGTLLIPTTVCLVKGGPNPDNARRLIDYLTTRNVEQKLIDLQFAVYSVRETAGAVQTMSVDYAAAAQRLHETIERATSLMRGQ
jgi:iron(III) transport system substrate-binding protein